jgi:hypothetical protein
VATTITLDGNSVKHTIPDKYAGLGGSSFRAANDFPVSGYRTALQNIAPEVLRWSAWKPVGTVASPISDQAAMKALAVFLGSDVAHSMGPGSARPNASPSTKATNDTTNVHADGEGSSPADVSAHYLDWINAGIDVRWVEPFNEPANSAAPYTNGGGPWFGTTPSGGATQTDINKSESWSYMAHRLYRNKIRADAIAAGKPVPKFAGGVIADTQPYAQNWAKSFVSGAMIDGATWPWPDANYPYFDLYAFHAYGGGSTDQGLLNSINFDPATFAGANESVAHRSFLRNMRAYMDAAGQPSKQLCWNEGGIDRFTAFAGLFDVINAILGFHSMSIFNIAYFAGWSYNVSPTNSAGIWALMSSAYVVNTRGRFNRDFIFYYSRNYKRQLISGTTGVVTTDVTPSSGANLGSNNSVPRLNLCAGLNAAGDKIGMLIANGDLTNSGSLTVNLANLTVTGNVVGKKALQSEAGTGATLLPAITPFAVGGNSFGITIEAGAVYLLEIPITPVTGGGGGGGVSHPVSGPIGTVSSQATGFGGVPLGSVRKGVDVWSDYTRRYPQHGGVSACRSRRNAGRDRNAIQRFGQLKRSRGLSDDRSGLQLPDGCYPATVRSRARERTDYRWSGDVAPRSDQCGRDLGSRRLLQGHASYGRSIASHQHQPELQRARCLGTAVHGS